MSIGGIDVVLLAPANECIGDTILRACRRYWPQGECIFQDVHEKKVYVLSDPWVWAVGTSRKEFFVYRDASALESWREEGAVKGNANSMFHFIIGDAKPGSPFLEVAMLFDKYTPAVRAFIKGLQLGFLSLMSQNPEPEAA